MRGVLLQFLSRQNSTLQVPPESCSECAKLESRVDAAISKIRGIVEGSFASLGQKLARLCEKQSLRDRALADFYVHKRNAILGGRHESLIVIVTCREYHIWELVCIKNRGGLWLI
jgi:hypothetical protein